MSRQDQYDVRVSVDGVDLGTFDTLTGGEIDSEETTYKPGAMGSRISLGGSVNLSNATVEGLYALPPDPPPVHWLTSRAGKGWAVVSKQPLDVDGNVFGRSPTSQGRLKQVTPPEHDSESS